ncbi:hypothetical protein OG336_19390 [[Kitasatospora] papulosa]|uniref:hypothetical protein n=1 Tax=[Kitasatospora] papulosa TaxID=1464011 RepID=UPI002E107E46|nr:hypothetical protein OG336_19390 [[Kitasatospora] papulosa]
MSLSEIGDTDEGRAYLRELPVKGFEYYRQAVQEMRSALAALEPYLIPQWEDCQWQTPDVEYAALLAQLKNSRRKTLYFYWGSDRRLMR